MNWIPAILLAFALLALAGVTFTYLKRASRARRELSQRLHDSALALDRRCDVLQDQVLTVDRRLSIDHLARLVDWGRSEGRYSDRTAQALRRYVRDLRAESHLPPDRRP
jgi:hypothetical protein